MISYDTNVLIYALEGGEFSEPAQQILAMGEKEGVVLSALVKYELLSGSTLHGGDTAKARAAFDSLVSLKVLDTSEEIIDKALALTQKYGKKCSGFDALLVATAILGGAKSFYTNDQDILKSGISEIETLGI